MRFGMVLVAAGLLAGCSASENVQRTTSGTSAAESVVDAAPAGRGAAGTDRVAVTVPRLAYSYVLGFVLPSDKIAEAVDAHRGLCEQMGPARCQLTALERGGGTDQSGGATLKLRVATADARAFSNSLTQQVQQAGGRTDATNVTGEDVSKQMTDTAARIRQRELLVARLTDMLRNRTGNVGQLVEAERSVAQAQEELDQARAWLTELQGRVAMSDFDIRYTAIAPAASASSTAGLLTEAVSASSATFMIGLRAVLTVAIYLLPWALLALPVILLARRFHRGARATNQP